MFVVFAEDMTAEQRAAIASLLRSEGLIYQEGECRKRALFVVSALSKEQILRIGAMEGVEKVAHRLSRAELNYYGVPFFPHHFLAETCVVLLSLAAVVLLASLVPAGLSARVDPADPTATQLHWYLAAGHLVLSLVRSAPLGALLQFAVLFVFLAWPFLDRSRTRRGRAVVFALGLLLLGAAVALTALGLAGSQRLPTIHLR